MKYITRIDALEELETSLPTACVMLTAEECLLRPEEQRLLLQSLLLQPPLKQDAPRLQQFEIMQTEQWSERLTPLAGKELIIRLPDRPVDAFLPDSMAERARLSAYMARSTAWVLERTDALRTFNPALSCRGCRMLIDCEGVSRALLRAIFAAAAHCGIRRLSFLLPFVAEADEVRYLRTMIEHRAERSGITCTVGAEIATPRAACITDELAGCADFLVFHIEELVQLLYGMSRYDVRKILQCYSEREIFAYNPFTEFDRAGVGRLLALSLEQLRPSYPSLPIGVIGQPALTARGRTFCTQLGITWTIGSCTALRSMADAAG